MMAIRVTKFLEINIILYKYQFGFRKKIFKISSTTSTTIDVVEDILEHLDRQEIGLGIYLDLKRPLILLIVIFYCINCITMASEG